MFLPSISDPIDGLKPLLFYLSPFRRGAADSRSVPGNKAQAPTKHCRAWFPEVRRPRVGGLFSICPCLSGSCGCVGSGIARSSHSARHRGTAQVTVALLFPSRRHRRLRVRATRSSTRARGSDVGPETRTILTVVKY